MNAIVNATVNTTVNATVNTTVNATVDPTVNVNVTACTAGKCSHTFNLSSDSVPSRFDSVSVAAENVVGVGPARTCPTQPISELNLMNHALALPTSV